VFTDRGGRKYDVDTGHTEILEVDGRAVEEAADGRMIYSDTREEIKFNE